MTVDASRRLQVYMPGFLPYTIEGKSLEATQLDVALVRAPPAVESPPALESPPLDRHLAWILMKAAIDAGRAGDCDTVKTIATEVQRADASLHAVVFVHEIAIARCLASP